MTTMSATDLFIMAGAVVAAMVVWLSAVYLAARERPTHHPADGEEVQAATPTSREPLEHAESVPVPRKHAGGELGGEAGSRTAQESDEVCDLALIPGSSPS